MKQLLLKHRSDKPHWVGDGFPVRSIFTYNDLAKHISPFLLMDYAGPTDFTPTDHRRGVGEHPHRGFETVTIVYSGEVEHRDSAGGGGQIGPGDVQWMTAASGLVHEEKHGAEFAKNGGRFEMIQLWVNLPAKDKMTKPRYQGLLKESIPRVSLKNDSGILRVIAGDYLGHKGPAKTFTAINLWDIKLNTQKEIRFNMPAGQTCLVFVLDGDVVVNGNESLTSAELGVLDPKEIEFTLLANKDSKILLLGGEPLNEPIVGYGPFVMNTPKEIQQAFADFESGKIGHIDSIEGSER